MSVYKTIVLMGKKSPHAIESEILAMGPWNEEWTWTADADYYDLSFIACVASWRQSMEYPRGTPGYWGERMEITKGEEFHWFPKDVQP